MNTGTTIFSQLMEHIPIYEFRKCVERYNGNAHVRTFSCWDQYCCMAFGQLTFRESLRDIEACLRTMQSKLYHMGIRGKVARSTLADANESRDWRIYADFAQELITIARKLYTNEDFGIQLEQTVYALDSTTIDLCLKLFPWARFRKRKGAVKLHTLLDLQGNIPTVIIITTGKVHDVNILDELIFEAGAFYVMDRGYVDFARLYRIQQNSAFFVTRAKKNFHCRRPYSNPVTKSIGVCVDQRGVLKGNNAKKDYPEKLRRIKFYDKERDKVLVFLTNNLTLPAITIALLYKSRWQVELFFKWIKQHLRIKAFYGTSENAVKLQVWVAISVYVLVAILKKRLGVKHSLYTILQILSVSLFEKMPILQALNDEICKIDGDAHSNQLSLFAY
ncbi:MAG: IS4 family transposase [Parcubacteria group bacterium]